jgi:hypothetical protein
MWRRKPPAAQPKAVPYVMVTNLARTLRELQEREIWVIGTTGEAESDLYAAEWPVATAWVLGAEGEGMRRLTRETCDQLVKIFRCTARWKASMFRWLRAFACTRRVAAAQLSHDASPRGGADGAGDAVVEHRRCRDAPPRGSAQLRGHLLAQHLQCAGAGCYAHRYAWSGLVARPVAVAAGGLAIRGLLGGDVYRLSWLP